MFLFFYTAHNQPIIQTALSAYFGYAAYVAILHVLLPLFAYCGDALKNAIRFTSPSAQRSAVTKFVKVKVGSLITFGALAQSFPRRRLFFLSLEGFCFLSLFLGVVLILLSTMLFPTSASPSQRARQRRSIAVTLTCPGLMLGKATYSLALLREVAPTTRRSATAISEHYSDDGLELQLFVVLFLLPVVGQLVLDAYGTTAETRAMCVGAPGWSALVLVGLCSYAVGPGIVYRATVPIGFWAAARVFNYVVHTAKKGSKQG